MRKILVVAFTLMTAAGSIPLRGQASPAQNKPSLLDGLKKAVKPVAPVQQGPKFQMTNFQTRQLQGQENPSWTLELAASMDFLANYYTLRAVVQSASGQILSTGDPIAVMGSAKNQVRNMTQPYLKHAGATAIQFSVLRHDGQTVATKVFDLPTTAGALAGSTPAGGVAAVIESGPVDLTERLDVRFNDQGQLLIRNQGSRSVRCEASVMAEFAVGISKRIPLSCGASFVLEPGASKVCTLQDTAKYLPCPTLTAFHAVVITAQGKRYDVARTFDMGDLEIRDVRIVGLKAQQVSYDDALAEGYFQLMLPNISVRQGTILTATFTIRVMGKGEMKWTHSFPVDSKGYEEVRFSGSFDGSNLKDRRLEVQLNSISTNTKLCCGNLSVPVLESSLSPAYTTILPKP